MESKKFSPALAVIACILALVIGFLAGFAVYTYIKRPTGGDKIPSIVSGELSFHFMELGTKATGDSIYIKAGDTDILIDAGSVEASTERTSEYIDRYCTDGVLEYVIATHADSDHIAGFAGSNSSPSIFDRYECETIIDFALTNKTTKVYEKYVQQRAEAVEAGAVHYTALQCWNETDGAKRVYELSDGIEMEILYNYYYENKTSNENNYSVCVMFRQGDKNFLFTGDLEGEGEEKLALNNELPEVELFKAGHHGSQTSCNDSLLSVIKPKIVCVSCCAGYNEYHAAAENVFPSQAMIDRVSEYTENVYVTTQYDESAPDGYVSMNGDIVITSTKNGIEVACSNNNTLLKDTEWFKENRTTPSAWLS